MAVKRKADEIFDEDTVTKEQLNEEAVISQETPPENVFIPPSVVTASLLSGGSYTYRSPIPKVISKDLSQPCVLGVDEAGRGPVLGAMVYGVAYLPVSQHRSLLADSYQFDDSKVLTPEFRSSLLQQWCTPSTELNDAVGWSVRLLSARDISAGMLRPKDMTGYNLNQQAMDATISLIQETLDSGINVTEIYIDTIGKPEVYQKKLEPIFPSAKITVAKKADSLYPCVSAASVAAKVTRDASLEVLWREFHASTCSSKDHETNAITESRAAPPSKKTKTQQKKSKKDSSSASHASQGWGSGYPSDGKCSSWLKNSMHPVFGWGHECRFSWGTVKIMLEEKGELDVEWPEPEDDDADQQISKFFSHSNKADSSSFVGDDVDDLLDERWNSLSSWYGSSVAAVA